MRIDEEWKLARNMITIIAVSNLKSEIKHKSKDDDHAAQTLHRHRTQIIWRLQQTTKGRKRMIPKRAMKLLPDLNNPVFNQYFDDKSKTFNAVKNRGHLIL